MAAAGQPPVRRGRPAEGERRGARKSELYAEEETYAEGEYSDDEPYADEEPYPEDDDEDEYDEDEDEYGDEEEDEYDEEEDEEEEEPPPAGPRRRLSAGRAAQAGLRQLAELISKDIVGMTSVEPTEDGWLVGVEVVEDHRIPSSIDVLGLYNVEVDNDGELLSYRRVSRYPRGKSEVS